MVILIAGLFCLARKRVEYLRNLVFYHRAKGEHPERKKNIKITNKTTPEKTGQKSPCVLTLGLNINMLRLSFFLSSSQTLPIYLNLNCIFYLG